LRYGGGKAPGGAKKTFIMKREKNLMRKIYEDGTFGKGNERRGSGKPHMNPNHKLSSS